MASTASLLGTKRKRGASASAAEVVRCICSTSADDGQEMIECDGCKVWQHTDCVGARAGQLSWRCERCDPRPPAQLAAMVAQARARRGMDVGPADEYVPLADDDLRALQPQLPELSSWRPRLALEHAQAVPPPGYAAEPRRLSGGQMCFAASYGLFARVRRERGDLLARFVAVVGRAADYLADPINMYPSLMLPKPYVHLLPAPTPLALDARRAGGEARFARCGCRPNAELVPAHVGPARQLVFVLVATRDIASGDEIVLPWEWDDMHPVHRLVRATPQTTNSANLRAHIASFLSAAEGFIPPCACTDPSTCLFVAMRRYAAAEHPLSPHPLPPLPKRGLAAVPRQGFGQGAVLLPPTSNSSTSSPDASSLWLPTPSTSPRTTFLSIASALHLHIQPDPAEQRLPHRMRKTHIRRLFDELKGAGAFERGRVWDPVGAVTVRKVGAAPNAGGAGSRSASTARSGSVASGVRANGAGGGGGGKKRGKMDVLSLLADGGAGGGGGAHTANGHIGDVPVTPLAALSLERERERRPLSPAFPSAPASAPAPAPERPLSPAFPEPKPPPPDAAQAEAAGAQTQSQGGAAGAQAQADTGANAAQPQAPAQPQIDPALMAIDSPTQPTSAPAQPAAEQMDGDPSAPPPPAPPAPPQPGRRTTFSAWLRNRKVNTASVGAGGEGVVLSPGGVVESPGGVGASEPGAGFGVGAGEGGGIGASEPGGVGTGAGAGAEDVAMPEPGEVLPGELVPPPAEGGVPEPGEVRPGEDEQQQTREKQAHEDAVTSIIEEALGWRQPSGGPSRLQELQPQPQRRPSGEQLRRPSDEQQRRPSGEQQRRPSGEQQRTASRDQRTASRDQRSASRDQPPMQRFPQPPDHLRPSSREPPGLHQYPPAEQRRPYDPPRSPPPGQGHRGPPHDSRQLHRPPSPRQLHRPPYDQRPRYDQRPPSPRPPFDPLHRPPYDQRPYPPDAYQQQHGPPYDAGRPLYDQERPPHDQAGPYDAQRRPFEHASQRPGPYDHARRPSFGLEQQQEPPFDPHRPPSDEQHLQRPPFEHQQRGPGPFDHPQRPPYDQQHEQRPPSHSRHPSASATPRHPSATMTPRHSSASAAPAAQHPSAATPRHPSAAMTPRHPSAAATPQHPSAARRDSQMMVDEQAANANTSASASDSPGEDAPPPATRSPQSDTTAPPPQTPEEEGEVVRVKSEEGWAAVPGDAVVVVPAKRARSPSSSAGSTTKTPRRFGRFNQPQAQLQNPHDRRLPEHRRASAGLADRRASRGPPNRRVSGGIPYGEVERYQPPYRDFGGPSPTRDKFGGPPPPPPPGPGRDFHHPGPGPGPGRHPDFPQREYAPDFGRVRDYGRPPPPPPLPPAERTHGWGTSPPRDWAAAAGAWEEREREQRERSRAWGGERFADEPPPPPMPHHSGWAPPPDAPYDYERGPPPPPPPPNQPRTWGDYDAVGYPHRDRGRFGNGAPSAPRAMRGYP